MWGTDDDVVVDQVERGRLKWPFGFAPRVSIPVTWPVEWLRGGALEKGLMDWRSPQSSVGRCGPPAVFTVDAWGRLGVDEARTEKPGVGLGRTAAQCMSLFVYGPATGWVQYVLVTAEVFVETSSSRDPAFREEEAALRALNGLGSLPVRK